jgi:hypothetical protein
MSVSENIAYGLPNKDVSHEVIVEAAKAANAHDFIVSLPEVRIEAYKPIPQSEPEIRCHSWTLMNNTPVLRGYTALTLHIQILVKKHQFTDYSGCFAGIQYNGRRAGKSFKWRSASGMQFLLFRNNFMLTHFHYPSEVKGNMVSRGIWFSRLRFKETEITMTFT